MLYLLIRDDVAMSLVPESIRLVSFWKLATLLPRQLHSHEHDASQIND